MSKIDDWSPDASLTVTSSTSGTRGGNGRGTSWISDVDDASFSSSSSGTRGDSGGGITKS